MVADSPFADAQQLSLKAESELTACLKACQGAIRAMFMHCALDLTAQQRQGPRTLGRPLTSKAQP